MEPSYIKVGDYFIPDLKLEPGECPIGRWGRLHWEYLPDYRSSSLVLSGKLWTELVDLNEQAEGRGNHGGTESLEYDGVVGAMNNISERVREIIYSELIYS